MSGVGKFPDFACPHCHGVVPWPARDAPEAVCTGCGAHYGNSGRFVDMLGGAPKRRTPAQWAMEWAPLVGIYESRFWRRSPMFMLATGIAFDRELAVVRRALGLRGGETILDIACGTGIYTRPLAGSLHDGVAVGLDLSPAMLEYAAGVTGSDANTNLRFVRASALEVPFANDTFDAVTCCAALHLMPDVPRVLAQMSRVLRPGGRVALAVFRSEPGAFGSFVSDARRRALGIDSFRPEKLEAWLGTAGFEAVEFPYEGWTWMIAGARLATG